MHTAGVAAVLATAIVFPGVLLAQPPPIPRDGPSVRREGTAVIKGRAVDAVTGAAVPRARVRLSGGGATRPFVLSDASGAFTFPKLPGGRYLLFAEKSGYLPSRYPTGPTVRMRARPVVLTDGQSVEDVAIQMYRASAISGRVVDAHGDAVEFAEVRVLRIVPGQPPDAIGGSNTNDIGEFRIGRLQPGSYLLLASAQRMGRGGAEHERASAIPLPAYYPGVVSVDQAQPIVLGRGESVSNIELVLAEGTATVITGTMVTMEGQPVTENGWVHARLLHGSVRMEVEGSDIGRDGSFRLELAPGEYVLEGRAMLPQSGKDAPPQEKVGFARLTVDSSPVESVTLVVGNGAVVTGRVVFEGSTPPPPPPSGPAWVPLDSGSDGSCRPQQARVNPDWTFRIEGLIGTCMAPYQPWVGRWIVKSVIVNGDDVLTQSITFEPGQQVRDVQVVLTDRRSSLTFRVADEAGQPTREYVALVYVTEKARWQKGPYVRTYVPPQFNVDVLSAEPRPGARLGPASRVRPETLEAVPPGEYYVVAVDDLDADAVRSTELLERLIPGALRVTVAEGASMDVALRRIRMPDGR